MNILEELKEGNISAPQAYVLISEQIEILKEQKQLIKTEALEEARTFNKGEAYYGYVWEVRKGRTIYEFEKDPKYNEINDELKQRRALLTKASQLRELGKSLIDEESGELISGVSIKSVSEDSLLFKVKK